MEEGKRTRKEVLLFSVFAIIAIGVGIFITVSWRQSKRTANERAAVAAIKTLAIAEAEFRSNDRDGNGVNDFWTGDVAGLFNLAIKGQELQLIAREIAEADADPIRPILKYPRPYRGYYFAALETDDSTPVRAERFYRQDTGGTPAMGAVHHESKFGFIAYPAEPGVTGSFWYRLNEGNTIFRAPATGKRPKSWPSDDHLKNVWGGGGDD